MEMEIESMQNIQENNFNDSYQDLQNEENDKITTDTSFTKKMFKFFVSTLGLKNFLSKLFIYHPPNKTYKFSKNEVKSYSFGGELKIDILKPQIKKTFDKFLEKYNVFIEIEPILVEFTYKQTKQQNSIPIIMIKNRFSTSNHLIIYSHGNSSDLGSVINTLLEFSRIYSINFMAYDYRGYGLGKGVTTEESTYEDLEIAMSIAINKFQYKQEQIILWGFSLGSCPTTEIASRYSSICAVVLEAPLASVCTYIYNDFNLKNQDDTSDIYANVHKIQNVQCPIIIFHGKGDEVIPYQHSQYLLEKYKQSNPHNLDEISCLLIEEIKHNDIKFLLQIEKSVSSSKLRQFLFKQRKKVFHKYSKFFQNEVDEIELKKEVETYQQEFNQLSQIYDSIYSKGEF